MIKVVKSFLVPDQYCPDPGKVEHGNYICPGGCGMYKVGTHLHYICDDNYEPSGIVKQTCLSGGKWSSDKPSCAPGKTSAKMQNILLSFECLW